MDPILTKESYENKGIIETNNLWLVRKVYIFIFLFISESEKGHS